MLAKIPNRVHPRIRGQVVTRTRNHVPAHPLPTFSVAVENKMQCPVFYRDARGMMIVQDGIMSVGDDEEVLFHISYTHGVNARIDSRALWDEHNQTTNTAELKDIRETVDRWESIDAEPYYNKRFTYTVVIARHQLEENGGVIEVPDTNLILGIDNEHNRSRALHPDTLAGQADRLSKYHHADEATKITYVLVDSTGKIDDLWLNTGQQVLKIVSTKNDRLKDGLWVITTENGRTQTKHHDLTDPEKDLGLYRTRNEAIDFGSPDDRFKLELKELERENIRKKAELESLKAELAREKELLDIERKRQEAETQEEDRKRKREEEDIAYRRREMEDKRKEFMAEMEFERERIRMNREREAEEAKHKHSKTKMALEWLKHIGAAIALIGSFIALYNKLAPK